MLPWGKKAEAVKKAEELAEACANFLEMQPKKLGKSGRAYIARRSFDSESEMRAAVCSAMLSSHSDTIEACHFHPVSTRDAEALADSRFEKMSLEEVVGQKMAHFFSTLGKVEAHNVHDAVIRKVERPLIEKCLEWAQGNRLKAARVLGLNRGTLRKKICEMKINVPEKERS